MIATIAAIGWEKKSSAIIWKPLSEIEHFISQRLLSLRSLENGFIWSLRSLKFFFFLSDRTDHSDKRSYGNRALIWSWRILNVRIAYSENLYLNCVSQYEKALKASDIEWPVSISVVIWSSVLISVTWMDLLWAVYIFLRINNIDPTPKMFVCPVAKIS